jgi:trehalose/maltose transport system substrate-binding protein
LSTELEKPDGQSIDARLSGIWEKAIVADFQAATGAKVIVEPVSSIVDERLEQYKIWLNSSVAPEDSRVDVLAIDVIWSGLLAKYAMDLTPEFRNPDEAGPILKFLAQIAEKYRPEYRNLDEFNTAIINNNTVDGKLVGVPWYSDAGLLFYRKGLLEKYNISPPKTWGELEAAAAKIQKEERANGKPNFWGYVWQGGKYEGLTCNALEWQVSHGGGLVVAKGSVNITEGPTKEAFQRARNWIGSISPSDITSHTEADSFNIWMKREAAFMRNWPYAYLSSTESGVSLQGDVGVTLLPIGNGSNPRNVATLGGWQLMVNAKTTGKQRKAAVRFIKYLTEPEVQRSMAVNTGKIPSLKSLLYNDPPVLGKLPFLAETGIRELFTGDTLDNALVARPSRETGETYPHFSKKYNEIVHDILTRKIDAEAGVTKLRNDIQHMLDQYMPNQHMLDVGQQ